MSTSKVAIRQILVKSSDPAVQEVANDPKLLQIIEDQFNKAKQFYDSKVGQAVVFGGKQIATTVKMAKNVTPSGIAVLGAQKFLLTGKLVAENDLVKCGIAVSFLATEGVLAGLAGVPTGGTAWVLAAAPLVASAYATYDSCKEIKLPKK